MKNKSTVQLWRIFFLYSLLIIGGLALLSYIIGLGENVGRISIFIYFLLLVINIINNFFDGEGKIETNSFNQGVFTLLIAIIFVTSIIPISEIYLREENYEILFIILIISWLICFICFTHLKNISNYKNEVSVIYLNKERERVKNTKTIKYQKEVLEKEKIETDKEKWEKLEISEDWMQAIIKKQEKASIKRGNEIRQIEMAQKNIREKANIERGNKIRQEEIDGENERESRRIFNLKKIEEENSFYRDEAEKYINGSIKICNQIGFAKFKMEENSFYNDEYETYFETIKICTKIGFTKFKLPDNLNILFNVGRFIKITKELNLEVYFGWSALNNSCDYIILSFGKYPDMVVDDYAENVPEAIRLLKREPKLEYEDWDSYNERKKDAQNLILNKINGLLQELSEISIFNDSIFTMPSSKPLINNLFKEIGVKMSVEEKSTKKQIECKNFLDSCENASLKMHFPQHQNLGSNCIIVDDILGWGGGLTHVNKNIGMKPNLFIYFAHDKRNR